MGEVGRKMQRLGCYQGGENHTARRATLLNRVGAEVQELCPWHNPGWRFQYLEEGKVYYSLGECPRRRCELAELIELRLTIAFGYAIQLERLPEECDAIPAEAGLIHVSEMC